MTQNATPTPGLPTEGLGLLLDQLARDGWLVGLNTEVDPTLVRMDPKTGVYSREYLTDLVQEAISDARAERPRLLDGPEQGHVALVTLRVSGWERMELERGEATQSACEVEVARRLAGCLRAEDSLGRTRADTFTLLLRGCPTDHLQTIAGRCRDVVEEPPIISPTGPLNLVTVAAATEWKGEDATDFFARALGDLAKAASTDV